MYFYPFGEGVHNDYNNILRKDAARHSPRVVDSKASSGTPMYGAKPLLVGVSCTGISRSFGLLFRDLGLTLATTHNFWQMSSFAGFPDAFHGS